MNQPTPVVLETCRFQSQMLAWFRAFSPNLAEIWKNSLVNSASEYYRFVFESDLCIFVYDFCPVNWQGFYIGILKISF